MKGEKGDGRLEKYAALIRDGNLSVFEYEPGTDRLRMYDADLQMTADRNGYLEYMKLDSRVSSADRTRLEEFCRGWSKGEVEIEMESPEDGGKLIRKELHKIPMKDEETGREYLLGWLRDVTAERGKQMEYENRAQRDSMTQLYNHTYGKELINAYLANRTPYSSCGMMVLDVDYFKSVNDNYGHLFGDKVLVQVALLLTGLFRETDIIMRAGGDEFVVLVRDIDHNTLVRRSMEVVKAVRSMRFEEHDYAPTCSVGVCYLPENASGYNYDQLFQNADWALYRAKEGGRNRYMFCDDLRRFEKDEMGDENSHPDIDARYFQNDMVATAFEVFEKTNSFDVGIRLLLEIIGIRFQLDRITVIRTDIREQNVGRQYQWCSERAPEVLQTGGDFTKEDFLTLFQSYDEYGTTVLNYDNMEMYSRAATELLMQGGAKTVLYAATYNEGHYTGAISYVVCTEKRFWSRHRRKELGEVTKIIAAYLAKNQVVNVSNASSVIPNEYDHLTGLLSFARFREEVERIIVGGYARSYAMVYTDFDNFKYYNQKYGYSMGDELLKEFATYIIGTMTNTESVYFSRVVSDQFILFMPYDWKVPDVEQRVKWLNDEFLRQQMQRTPEAKLRIRTGIYRVSSDCLSAAEAIDAANFARKQVRDHSARTVILYNEEMGKRQNFENEMVDGMDTALRDGQFCVYLQPKFSLETGEIQGAEALIRWHREDGEVLTPDMFVPLYEANGRIVELDFYVIEEVASFLARMKRLGRPLYPISVNASVLHATDGESVRKYREILDRYEVDCSLVEIELTETATVTNYENARRLFRQLQEEGFHTAMDDFGAGYSVLNMIIDVPVNTVKLDRVFISNCENTSKGVLFLQQVIKMIRNMGYQVLCEGVETVEQVKILREAGCEMGQGFLISRPVPLVEFEKMVYGEQKPIPAPAAPSTPD